MEPKKYETFSELKKKCLSNVKFSNNVLMKSFAWLDRTLNRN